MVDGTLDKLIREKLITEKMATSLASDSKNVADISKHLITAAELLYIESDLVLEGLGNSSQPQSTSLVSG